MEILKILFFLGIGFFLRGCINLCFGKDEGQSFLEGCLFVSACLICSIPFMI